MKNLRYALMGTCLFAAACAGTTGTTTTPSTVTPAAIAADASAAISLLTQAGCAVSAIGAAAAPIIMVAADAKGQAVYQAVNKTSGAVCVVAAGPTATPIGTVLVAPVAAAPAAPVAPAAPAAAPTSMLFGRERGV